jgi:hypothetical protein
MRTDSFLVRFVSHARSEDTWKHLGGGEELRGQT